MLMQLLIKQILLIVMLKPLSIKQIRVTHKVLLLMTRQILLIIKLILHKQQLKPLSIKQIRVILKELQPTIKQTLLIIKLIQRGIMRIVHTAKQILA